MLRTALALAVLLSTAAVASALQAGISGNIIKNSGFEQNADGLPDGWTFAERARQKGTAVVVSTRAATGRQSLAVSPNGNNDPWGIADHPLGVGQGVEAAPYRGKRVAIEGALAAEGGAVAVAGIYVLMKSGHVELVQIRQESEAREFSRYSDSLVVPDDDDVLYLIVNCTAEGVRGTAYFDDIQVGVVSERTTSRDANAPPAASNLLQNGSFESRENGLPTGWTVEERARGKGEVAVGREGATSGSFSLRLSPNRRNDPSDIANHPLGIGQGFEAARFRGKTVSLSAWLSAEGGAEAVATLVALSSDGSVEMSELGQSATGGGPVQHRTSLLVPDADKVLYLIVNLNVRGTSGAAYFDDVFLTEGELDAPSPGGGSDLPQDMSATIRIEAGDELRRIPDTLYGTNIEWIWDANGIWDSARDRLEPSLVELTRELRVSLLRFPGGTFSDYYDWRDGIGDRSKRPTTEHMPEPGGGARSKHYFGTDEALDFADRVGGELLITVNAGTGTPEDAAEWVRYVNRDGKTRVRYWEVGNELYVDDKGHRDPPVTVEPEEYARRFLRFAKAMREADPTIQVGAIAEESFGSKRWLTYPDWTDVLLRIAGKEIDFLAVHNAYGPVLPTDPGVPLETVYRAMLAAPGLIQDNFEELSERIERLVPGRGSQIRIAVTEWGPYFHFAPTSRHVDHVKTLGSALFTGSTMAAFMRSPRVDIANFFKLNDELFMGWIGRRKGEQAPKASYLALQLFTEHFGERLVRSTTTSPTFDSQTVGRVPAVRDVPYLDVVASLDERRRTLYVLAVNRHFEESIETTIEVDGFRVPRRGVSWQLRGTGIDAHTGTQLLQVPGLQWAEQAVASENPRFHRGGPDEVQIVRQDIRSSGGRLSYDFPPHSITVLELSR